MNGNQGRKSASPTTSSGTSTNQKPMQNVGRSGASQSSARNHEALHMMGQSLGGQSSSNNLVAGTARANTQQLQIETHINRSLRGATVSASGPSAKNEPQGARSGGASSTFGAMSNIGRNGYK